MSRSLPTKQSPELAAQTGGIGSAEPANWGYAPGYDIGSMETTAAGARVGRSMRSMPTPPLPPGFTGSSNIYPGNANGGLAKVMGGEYIMSPQTTAQYGTGFMAELNRGRMPGFNMGGAVGGGGLAAGGITTNNVNLAINIDKGGKSSVQSESSSGSGQDKEREDKSEVDRQKKMGEAIRGVVLKEIERQQRPGGLLRDNASYAGGRKP